MFVGFKDVCGFFAATIGKAACHDNLQLTVQVEYTIQEDPFLVPLSLLIMDGAIKRKIIYMDCYLFQ